MRTDLSGSRLSFNAITAMSRPAQRLRGLAIKFSDWCEKRNKKYTEIRNCFISIQSLSANLNTCVAGFENSAKASKGTAFSSAFTVFLLSSAS
jgi:hypothetical protein